MAVIEEFITTYKKSTENSIKGFYCYHKFIVMVNYPLIYSDTLHIWHFDPERTTIRSYFLITRLVIAALFIKWEFYIHDVLNKNSQLCTLYSQRQYRPRFLHDRKLLSECFFDVLDCSSSLQQFFGQYFLMVQNH